MISPEEIFQLWKTAETIDVISGRIWWLNVSLAAVAGLLTLLLFRLGNKEK